MIPHLKPQVFRYIKYYLTQSGILFSIYTLRQTCFSVGNILSIYIFPVENTLAGGPEYTNSTIQLAASDSEGRELRFTYKESLSNCGLGNNILSAKQIQYFVECKLARQILAY